MLAQHRDQLWRAGHPCVLVLAAVALWTFHRTWTYLHFVPIIGDLSEGSPDTPLTADQLDHARSWINLTWIRNLVDITTTVLVMLASFTPMANRSTGQGAK